MKKFTNKNLDVLRKDLNKALKSVSKKHGIDLSFGSMRYSSLEVRTKLTCNIAETLKTKKSLELAEKEDFNNFAALYDLPTWGTYFVYKGEKFKSRNTKYPVVATDENNKNYKFTINVVKECYAAK